MAYSFGLGMGRLAVLARVKVLSFGCLTKVFGVEGRTLLYNRVVNEQIRFAKFQRFTHKLAFLILSNARSEMSKKHADVQL